MSLFKKQKMWLIVSCCSKIFPRASITGLIAKISTIDPKGNLQECWCNLSWKRWVTRSRRRVVHTCHGSKSEPEITLHHVTRSWQRIRIRSKPSGCAASRWSSLYVFVNQWNGYCGNFIVSS